MCVCVCGCVCVCLSACLSVGDYSHTTGYRNHLVSRGRSGGEQPALVGYTVEPLNKGHLHTEGIVPYSVVDPYWEVFQKK